MENESMGVESILFEAIGFLMQSPISIQFMQDEMMYRGYKEMMCGIVNQETNKKVGHIHMAFPFCLSHYSFLVFCAFLLVGQTYLPALVGRKTGAFYTWALRFITICTQYIHCHIPQANIPPLCNTPREIMIFTDSSSYGKFPPAAAINFSTKYSVFIGFQAAIDLTH